MHISSYSYTIQIIRLHYQVYYYSPCLCDTSVFILGSTTNLLSADNVVSDRHIAEMADEILEWENLAPFLDLTEPEIVEIQKNDKDSYKLQRINCLRKWKRHYGDRASYNCLLKAARDSQQEHLIKYILALPGIEDEVYKDDTAHKGEKIGYHCCS